MIGWKKVIWLEILVGSLYGGLFVARRMGLLDRVLLELHSAFLAIGFDFEQAVLGATVVLMAMPLVVVVAVAMAILLIRRVRAGNGSTSDPER